ncbi:hypothetical protein [Kitasatospora sp. A2-31]|uniref:hypothetical protein n=1 Tax=Kitasatospora sp. A2-31 TaxID=2916414 RepID=UPI001EEE3D61|nr:hypothetical protein [Kitasatospora sp. A2-31]MCG6498824.1 hypothetical protein [Kitasatospora sp. A2-31]
MSGDGRGAAEVVPQSAEQTGERFVVPPAERFAGLMAEVMAAAERFGHRQHVHLTWLAVRRHGTAAAVDLVGEGIRRTALAAGAPEKYHATMTRAWVELVGHHAGRAGTALDGGADRSDRADFEAFADRHPELLDKALLSRFYRTATLASAEARAGWVEPDLRAFPWHAER